MKKVFLSILSVFVAVTAIAHNNVVIIYEVTTRDTDSGNEYSHEMTLFASPEKSLYYNKLSLYVDSCNSTPAGKAKLREIQLKAWRVVQPDGTVTYDGRKLGLGSDKTEYLYVAKESEPGLITVYDRKADELWRYEEPMTEMEWTIIGDSTKNILGFECIMAQTDYHGRKWTAWFSPEIPIQDGPWKLHGLPGMILNAEAGDCFVIEAKEVGFTKLSIPEVYSINDYTRGERKRILAEHEHYENNFESMMAAQGVKMNADGSSAELPKYDRAQRAWETDY